MLFVSQQIKCYISHKIKHRKKIRQKQRKQKENQNEINELIYLIYSSFIIIQTI